MKQNKFIFNKQKKMDFYDDLPFGLGSAKSILKEKLLKQGYLVKDLKAEKIIVAYCWVAKANISREERIKFQKEIDEMKNITVLNPYSKG